MLLLGLGGLLLLVGASVAAAGVWLAYRWYVERPESAGRFVERIPFTETRGYVRVILRNREMYRTLYGWPPASPE